MTESMRKTNRNTEQLSPNSWEMIRVRKNILYFFKIFIFILSGGSSGSDGSGSGSSSDDDSDDEEENKKETIVDATETNLVSLRRTIYLTIQSALDFEEAVHKLNKLNIKPG